MRPRSTIPLTLAVSAVVHVAIFGAAQLLPDPPHLEPEKPVTIELVPPTPMPVDDEVPPTEVVLLDEAPEAAAPAPSLDARLAKRSPTPSTTSTTSSVASSTTPSIAWSIASSTTPSGEVPSTDTSPTRNPYLDMRRAPQVARFVRDRWDDLDHVPKGTTPQKDISTGKLAPDGGGTHRSDQGAFTAKIDRDGSVKLSDAKNFHIHIALPSPSDLATLFQDWYYDPNKPVGTLGPPNQGKRQANLTREDVSGAERLYGTDSTLYASEKDPHPGDGGAGLPILAGGFDVTDALMRSKGIDPYAAKKLAFLDSTRDERVQIGTKYKREQLAQVAQIVKKNLARVWTATSDPQQRKQALFEMWDECVETGSAEVVEAAATARKMIVGFMRANFPASGPNPFTAAEIAACNRAKKSTAMFAPYE